MTPTQVEKITNILEGCEIALEALELIVGFDDLDDLVIDIAVKAIDKVKKKLSPLRKK